MTNPSRPASNGRAARVGSSFQPGDSARMMSNAPKASGLSGTSTPPAIAASISPVRIAPSASPRATAPDAHELAVDRIGPWTSRAMPRLAGAAPPNTASASVRAHRADAALEVALVLLLGVRDAAERAAEVDPDPIRIGAGAALASRPASSSAMSPGRRGRTG